MTVRTRFAPSPTGYLHIGGVRTALFAWLHARKHNGQFILRIEDTDRERSTQESVDAILEGMQWLGLDYDEGPIYQTDRFDRYKEIIQQLLDQGDAYYCYCTKERLDEMREQQRANKEKPRYDGLCRDRQDVDASNPSPVVRFRNPKEGQVIFEDVVRGTMTVDNKELDDLIIARADGTPTYNLTVVVDDWDMGITDVIRGDDHLNNTPRQINILKALNAPLPRYGHVPMILGSDGKRLSKRHGAVSVMQYREDGYLPDALLNYLVRLGWSAGEKEIFSRADMLELFELSNVNRAASTFNPEKLVWINHDHIKNQSLDTLTEALAYQLDKRGVIHDTGPQLKDVVDAQRERTKTLEEMADKSVFFYQDFTEFEEKAAKKNLKVGARAALEGMKLAFQQINDWSAEPLHVVVHDIATELDLKLGKVAQPLRVAISGGSVSPPIDITLELVGKERVLQRLDLALAYIDAHENATAT